MTEPNSDIIPVNPPTIPSSTDIASTKTPLQQLGELPDGELNALADEYGLDVKQFKVKSELVSALHERRQLIASMDRETMLEVLAWAGKIVPATASKDQIAIEIIQNRSMRFSGLSSEGLYTLAKLRGCEVSGELDSEGLIRAMKNQEGFFGKIGRKGRSWFGKKVAGWMGETNSPAPDASSNPSTSASSSSPTASPSSTNLKQANIREEIEESGLFSGIANRVKKQADSYLNQKLDEIEARIDRKLDEIDRRLAEWRDKEIANRLRILKITLWASVIAAIVSLLYSYVYVMYKTWNKIDHLPSTTHTQLMAPAPTTPNMVRIIETHTNPLFKTSSNASSRIGPSI